MEFEKVIRERFSVRSFGNRKVEKEKLDKILEAGNLAPTAKNIQPQRIYIVSSDEGLKKLDEITPCRYNAQTCLIVCSDKTEAFHKEDYSTYEIDACIVVTHMMLEATNLGVDNIWIEMFDSNKIKELFNLSENVEPVCILNLGYKNEDVIPSPMHKSRKNINELVKYV